MNVFFSISLPLIQQQLPALHPDAQQNLSALLYKLFYGELSKDQFVSSLSTIVPPEYHELILSPKLLAPIQRHLQAVAHPQAHVAVPRPVTGPSQRALTWEPYLPVFTLDPSRSQLPYAEHNRYLYDIIVSIFTKQEVNFMPECLTFFEYALDHFVVYVLRSLVFLTQHRLDVHNDKLNSDHVTSSPSSGVADIYPFLKEIADAESKLREQAEMALKAQQEEKDRKSLREAKKTDDKNTELAIKQQIEERTDKESHLQKIASADQQAAEALASARRLKKGRETGTGRGLSTSRKRKVNVLSKDLSLLVNSERHDGFRKCFR
ncbi:hypothetical protein GEMRC1_004799 [Eukaryota sp. GEM-RC1]